jgi:hypothetical protein
MVSVANPIQNVKNYFTVEKQQGKAGQHLAPAQGVQARRVGQTKSGAKRQHIKGREDGRK